MTYTSSQRAEQARINFTKHGMFGTPVYRAWAKMIERCSNPRRDQWRNYGGRGIKVCDRWRDFRNFFADIGPRPTLAHSLDRIDVNGNYEPGNVRWALAIDQQNNRRNNHFVVYRDERMTIADAVRRAGNKIGAAQAAGRIRLGWDVARAVETISTRQAKL